MLDAAATRQPAEALAKRMAARPEVPPGTPRAVPPRLRSKNSASVSSTPSAAVERTAIAVATAATLLRKQLAIQPTLDLYLGRRNRKADLSPLRRAGESILVLSGVVDELRLASGI